MGYRRSKGAVLLARTGETQEQIAAETGIHRTRVGHYLIGQRKPGKGRRQVFRARYDIPEPAWDEAPDAASTLTSKAPRPAVQTSAIDATPVQSRAIRLQQMVDDLLAKVMADETATPHEKAKVLASAAATTTLLGKLTGEASQISESRVMLLPAWRRIKTAMLSALEPWPEAMRAVGEALKGLGG